MNKTLKSIKENGSAIFIIAITLCFFLVGCKDDTPCDTKTIENNMDAYQRSRCPHNGSDALVFISNRGDTVNCAGTGEKKGFVTYSEGPAACPTTVSDEQIYLEYFPNKPTFANILTIKLRAGAETFLISVNNKEYRTYFSFIQEYKYTYLINTNKGFKSCTSIGDSIYYNHQDGIVKYVQNDSTVWNRKL